jgi:hypothetical protein
MNYWVTYGVKLYGQFGLRINRVRIIEEPLYIILFVMYRICTV